MWASLSAVQRAKALQRMAALDRWLQSDGQIDVKQAAGEAGVSVTRMYEMGKAWRTQRSLASLGTFAAAPKTRVGKHDAVIRRAIGPLLDASPGTSVRGLTHALGEALRGQLATLPGHNTLRRYVERELVRRAREDTAGNDLQLDCSACLLAPSDTVMLTVFVILDRATQVILGGSLGQVGDSRGGFALAAADALRRLDRGQFDRLRWVDRVERCEIVVGTDQSAWDASIDRIAAGGGLANIALATSSNRFGRYLRRATRLRIGTMVLLPKHTVVDATMSGVVGRSAPNEDQVSRMSVEVDEYNAQVLADVSGGDGAPPPSDMIRLLAAISHR